MTLLNDSNQLLVHLGQNTNPDWEQALQELYPEGTEAQRLTERVSELAAAFHGAAPVGIYIGSTSQAQVAAGVLGEHGAAAVGTLKVANRIFQVGRGRGVAIIVFSTEELRPDEAVEQTTTSRPAADDIVARAISLAQKRKREMADPESSTSVEAFVANLRRASDDYARMASVVARLEAENADLRIRLESSDARIEEYRTRLETAPVASDWS